MRSSGERRIDLNADVGEGPGEEPLYALISSANIACGGHTGTEATMREAVSHALRHGVAIGAHPSYPDRAGFGRISMSMPPEELSRTIEDQIDALADVADALGARLTHVKPHGALYNDAARRERDRGGGGRSRALDLDRSGAGRSRRLRRPRRVASISGFASPPKDSRIGLTRRAESSSHALGSEALIVDPARRSDPGGPTRRERVRDDLRALGHARSGTTSPPRCARPWRLRASPCSKDKRRVPHRSPRRDSPADPAPPRRRCHGRRRC